MKKTLLELAKEVPIKRRKIKSLTDEDIELAVAWMKDEITAKQICVVKGLKQSAGNYLYFVAVALREAYHRGKISVK